MIGNAIDYDKRYKSNFPIFPAKFDWDLKRDNKLDRHRRSL